MSSSRWILASPFVLLALVALPGCSESRGGSQPPSAPPQPPLADGMVRLPKASMQYVRVAPVEEVAGAFEVRVPARVDFRDGAVSRVGSPVGGRVVAIAVRTGDRVAAGQPLLTLASSEAASARTAAASARAALREASSAADREERMTREGVGVERERLEAEARLSEAQAELERAEATTALVGEGRGTELVLRSPIAGMVIDLKASVGATVEPGGEPLVQVGDPASVWIVAEVTDRELPLIAEGSLATIELNAVPGELAARVVSIGSVVSDALRTAPVRLALSGTIPGLRPGTFGRARIKTAAHGATLPAEAVLFKGGTDPIVYVAKGDDTFERRTVVVGRPLEGRVQVLSGLSPGDRVVVAGALLLDGSAEQLL